MNNFSYVGLRQQHLRDDDEYLLFVFRSSSGETIFCDTLTSRDELEVKRERWRCVCTAVSATLYMNLDTLSWRTTALESLKRMADAILTERWRDAADPTTRLCAWPKPSPSSPGYTLIHLKSAADCTGVLVTAYRLSGSYKTVSVLAKEDGHAIVGVRDSDDVRTLLESDEMRKMLAEKNASFYHKGAVLIYKP